MKRLKILFAFAGLVFGMGVVVAHADEPTVTLTQTELQEIINAQVAAAAAQPAIKKVQSAFTPVPVKPTVAPPTSETAK